MFSIIYKINLSKINLFLFFCLFILLLFPSTLVLGQFVLPTSIPKNLLHSNAKHILETIQKEENSTKQLSPILLHLVYDYFNTQKNEVYIKKLEELGVFAEKNYVNNKLGVTVFSVLTDAYISREDTPQKNIEDVSTLCYRLYEKLYAKNDCFATEYLLLVVKCKKNDFSPAKKLLQKAYDEAKLRKCDNALIHTLIRKGDFLSAQYEYFGALSARMEALQLMDVAVTKDKNAFDYDNFAELYMDVANVHYKVSSYDEAVI